MDSDNEDHVVEGVARDGSTMRWFKLKLLGRGSFGVVHKVKPTKTDDQVFAVKSCLDEVSSTLRKESEILKGFYCCRNVVQCYGDMLSVEHGRRVYNLFLEFATSGTLLDLIKKHGGKIPESIARRYARMVVEGVLVVHDRGYVHCDLKPANILVYPTIQYGEPERLKIADFGLARRLGEMLDQPDESEGPWLPNFPGTAAYMPPESVNHAIIHPSLDIWSLGCVVLQMITGNMPWQFRSRIELVFKLVSKENTPAIPEGMSREGVDFLSKCFARDPNQRWTAQRLLRHPFLQPDCPSFAARTKFLQHAQPNHSKLPI